MFPEEGEGVRLPPNGRGKIFRLDPFFNVTIFPYSGDILGTLAHLCDDAVIHDEVLVLVVL